MTPRRDPPPPPKKPRIPRIVPMSHCWELIGSGGHDVPKPQINYCAKCGANVCDAHASTHEARHVMDDVAEDDNDA